MLLLLLFLLSSFFNFQASTQPLNSLPELAALFSLRASLGLRSKDWPRKTDPCSNWTGVTCRSGQVTAVNLSGLRRTRLGRRSPKFAVDGLKNLSRLESFNSTGFALPGPVPAWFGPQLPRSVAVLVLRNAAVNGTIPESLGQLSNLTVLDLSHNFVAGAIPRSIGSISNLKSLNLSRNDLGSSLPDSVWSLNLQFLDVSFNNLSGVLPESIRAESGLNVSSSVFDLSNNLYYGSISAEFQSFLRRFSSVNLSGNYFQGTVALAVKSTKDRSFWLNCFVNASNQRSLVDCQEFYRAKGMNYDGRLSPYSAPSPNSSHENKNVKKKKKKKRSHVWKYILAGVLGFVGLVIAVVLVFVLCFMRGRIRTAHQGGSGVKSIPSEMDPPSSSRVIGEAFTYEQLVRATSEFNGTNLIKKGHSGDLYRGVLESGFSVVVKRIDLGKVRYEGYDMELDLFAKASHTRFVPFLGHCSEQESEKFIVYKYMLHGDLSSALYKKPKVEEEGFESLDWITRLKIAVGVAEALCFLHHECDPPLVHRDIQASSILLDDKFEVRLGSLSEVGALEGNSQHNVFTSFLRRSQTSERRASGSSTSSCAYDIYCFGKVLLELITGKLSISTSSSNDPTSLEFVDSALRCIDIYDKESVSKIIDPSLVLDEDFIQEVWAVSVIAKTCLDPRSSKRPPARYVLKALENPLKVVRLHSRSGSARLRTTSSRASWHNAFFGSWRQSSSDVAMGSGPLRRSSTVRSQGSGGEISFTRKEHSFSHKRHSVEIFPEPSGEGYAY